MNNNRKYTIVFIIDRIAGLHGTEKYLYNFIQRFDKNKFSPAIISLYSENKIAKEFYELDIPVISIPIRKIFSPFTINKFFKLYTFIKRNHTDLIETIHRDSDFIGSVVGRLAGVKTIISNRRDMGFMRTKKDDIIYRIIDRFVDRIKCNTKSAAIYFSGIERVPISKFDVSYNGVDIDAYKRSDKIKQSVREEYGFKDDEIVVGILGGVKKVKGHKEFIEMADILSKKYNNLKFLVVGGGYKKTGDEYFEYIKDLCIQKGLQKLFIFTDYLTNPADVLSIFDIAVLPSYTEGCSNVLLEYMASGKPVVATNVGGNPELVKNELTGFIVPCKDVASLTQKTAQLINSKRLREKMGDEGYKRARDQFYLPNVVRAEMEYYENLILFKKR